MDPFHQNPVKFNMLSYQSMQYPFPILFHQNPVKFNMLSYQLL